MIANRIWENMCNFIVGIVPNDGVVSLGARASASTLMTKFRSCEYTRNQEYRKVITVWLHHKMIAVHTHGSTMRASCRKVFVRSKFKVISVIIIAVLYGNIHYKVWDEITFPFQNFQQRSCWSLGMDKEFHPTPYWACDYLSMSGLKSIHISKVTRLWQMLTMIILDHISH